MHTYTIVLTHEDDGRYSVSVPALPGCHTWGDSSAHATKMAHEAIELYLGELEAANEPIPSDTQVEVASVQVG
jgi:antitoxin HicB